MDITYFTIYGERCSGTNFVRKLIYDNFDLLFANLPENSHAGWKHWFGHPENVEAIQKSQGWCLVLSIVRNPVDYLVSFFQHPHHQTPERTKDFETFLTTEFWSTGKEGEVVFDRDMNNPQRRYKDIFEMRAAKIRFMLQKLPSLTTDQAFMTFEDLKATPEKYLAQWAEKWKLPRLADEWVVEKRRIQPQKSAWFRFDFSDTPMPESYTIDDPKIKEIVRSRLDFEAEALAGYDKESILKRLE